jgi:hypothetical protein
MARGGEESTGPRRGPLLWLNHRAPSGARLSLPPVGNDAQSIVGATILGGILT